MQRPNFWNDQENAQLITQKLKNNNDKIQEYNKIKLEIEEIEILIELTVEEDDDTQVPEIKDSLKNIEKLVSELRLKTLLNGEYDNENVILSIHAGAGGLEAQDWAEMLLRLYTRWIERHGFRYKTLDIISDPIAGIKSVTLLIEGEKAYGYLKSEKGVHRLVRISPFDSGNRRHTSFASIDITPEINNDGDMEINESDLRIDTYRASGSGGQHVNTTDSAVRITHIPTGVVVCCQNERSQHKNKETATKILKSKLIEIRELEHKEKIEDIQGKYNQIAWGSQIRSYVFHPYSMVKDHRTNIETGNTQSVMDGNIDLFINEYLKQISRKSTLN